MWAGNHDFLWDKFVTTFRGFCRPPSKRKMDSKLSDLVEKCAKALLSWTNWIIQI